MSDTSPHVPSDSPSSAEASGAGASGAVQRRLLALVEHSPDMIVTTDASGAIETWNRGAQEILGIPAEAVIGRTLPGVLKRCVEEAPLQDFFVETNLDAGATSGDSAKLDAWTILLPEPHSAPPSVIPRGKAPQGKTLAEGSLEKTFPSAEGPDAIASKKTASKKTLHVNWKATVSRRRDGEVESVLFVASDVSEIAAASRRIASSERDLRAVIESVTEAIVVLNDQWEYTYVNDGMCEMLDVERKDLLGGVVWEIFPEAKETVFESYFRQAMETGETVRFEELLPGSGRWYQCHCFPGEDQLTVFFSDVTDLRVSDDLMRQQGEMLELSRDAIVASQLDGGITFWNRGAELLYGFSKAEVMGKALEEILQPVSVVQLSEVLSNIRETGDWEGRVIHHSKEGDTLEIASRKQLVKLNTDGTEVILEINRDMTEYDDLSTRVAQLGSIADLTTDFVGTSSATGEVMYLNCGAATMLGYDSPEELKGKPLSEIYTPKAFEVLKTKALPAAEGGDVFHFESELVTKPGEVIPISQVVMAHVNSDGKATHYSTIARDISSQKKYAMELEDMRDAAEAANRAKSAFLAQMSHEIRTPMTAILGCGEQLQQSVKTEENQQLSRVMVEQGHALMAILDDILDLSRIEAEKIELEYRSVSIPRVLRDLHHLMTSRAEETGLSFKLDLQGEFPERLETDPVRFRQIVVNLLSNAFKFTSEGGVCLRAKCVHQSDRSILSVEVIDTGVGIPRDSLQGIFDAFSRLNHPMANASGTGLGLTIAHRLTKRLGGELDVESVPAKGTTFLIRIPIPSPSETAYGSAEFVQSPDRSGGKSGTASSKVLPVHVLVAEDTDSIRFLLSKILGGVVDKLTMVENGAQAVELVREDPSISMVLMDMQMPVMSGVEATRAIRHSGNQLPIIALTAGAMDADRKHCIDAGCTRFMSKPINKRKLIALIDELADDASE